MPRVRIESQCTAKLTKAPSCRGLASFSALEGNVGVGQQEKEAKNNRKRSLKDGLG
jgi:hypothetical protein